MQTANVEIKIKLVKGIPVSLEKINQQNEINPKTIFSGNENFLSKRNILINYNNRVLRKIIIENNNKMNVFDETFNDSKIFKRNKNSEKLNNSDFRKSYFVTVIY